MHEAAEELFPLLQGAFPQDLPESREVGQRVARGGLQIDGLELNALQIGEPRLDLLPANPDLPQALVDEVPVGRRGDVQEAVGLGLEGGELRLELADLLPWVRRLGQDLLGDEPPEDPLAAPGQVLPKALLDPSEDEVLEGIAAQAVSLADRLPLRPIAPADVVVGGGGGAVLVVTAVAVRVPLDLEAAVLADQEAR